MSLVGTLAKVAVAAAAAKGLSSVIGHATRPTSKNVTGSQPHGGPQSSVLGGQASGGLGSLLEQLAPGGGGASPATSPSSQTGGLDAIIRGLVEAASGARGAVGKASAERPFAEVLNQSFQKG